MSSEDHFNGMSAHYEHRQMSSGPSGLPGQAETASFGVSPPIPPPENFTYPEDMDNDSPLFATDEFRVWCMKVIPCTKRFVHDWTVCPFAHAGEKAVRRDPRTHSYTGIACPDMKKMGSCIRGERCPYAHNVFEYWLHPTRYRTQLCNDGPVCRRGICFFAHSLDELRVPACKPYVSPEALARASLDAIQANPHPLSAQLPLSHAGTQPAGGTMHPYGAHNQLSLAQQQQAAMAALSGGAGPGPSPFINMNGPDSTPPMGHTHTHPEPPRLSMDYGSLPRWSDCPTFVPGAGTHNNNNNTGGNNMNNPMGGAGRYSYDAGAGAGRYSYGRNSDYASACSTPARLSADVERNHAMAAMQQHHQQQQRELYQQQQRDLGSFAEASSGRSSGNSQRSGGSPPPGVQGQQQQQYSEQRQQSGGIPSPVRRSSSSNNGANSGEIQDDELAHSLATLKIALTQQNAAATTASNHEVVINTLHQILREAVAQQGGNDSNNPNSGSTGEDGSSAPSTEDASSAAAAAYAALASSMAAFAHNGAGGAGTAGTGSGSESYPGSRTLSISEVSGDTPNRLSLETVGSPSGATAAGNDGGLAGAPGRSHGDGEDDGVGPNERSTYRLSQDLVHALY